MSAQDVVLCVPCDVVDVRVRTGPASAMSDLEQAALRAIGGGLHTVDELAEFLGVPSRILYDLVGDLFRADHVWIEFGTPRLHLTAATQALAADGTLGQAHSAEITGGTLRIMLDRLTGRVLPESGRTHPAGGSLVVPDRPDDYRPEDCEPGALTAALSRAIELEEERRDANPDTRPTVRRRRVLGAHLVPHELRGPGQRRFQELVVRLGLDPDGELSVRVVDERIPLVFRAVAERRLAQLAVDMPDHRFVQALRAKAGSGPVDAALIEHALGDLTRQAGRLHSAVRGTRRREHDRIAHARNLIAERIRSAADREVELRVVDGRADNLELIGQLIDSAERQLILIVPWVRATGLTRLRTRLQRALERGVQVVLLWGIGRDDALDGEAVKIVYALQRIGRDEDGGDEPTGVRRMIVAEQSAVVHAKVVLADERRALVTSLNFLSDGPADTREVGVHVAAPGGADDRRRCRPLEAILHWARDTMPDLTNARAILTDPATFGRRPDPVPPALPQGPDLSEAAELADSTTAAVLAWSGAWESTAAELAVAARRPRPVARLIGDSEHRRLMRRALDTAERQVLVTSDRLGDAVVDAAFVDAVAACLARGVRVDLVYQRFVRDTGEDEVVQPLRALAATWNGLFTLTKRTSHAKVLVVDDQAVVGSYNFLSFDGDYAGSGRRRQRSEISMHVDDPATAATVLGVFGVPVVAADTPTATPGDDRTARDLGLAQELIALLGDTDARVTAPEIAEVAAGGTTPTAVLRALDTVSADTAVIERVTAAVLAHADVDAGEQAVWWPRLVRAAWERGDGVAAAAMRVMVPDTAWRPRETVVRAAALRGDDTLGQLLCDAALTEDLDEDETGALALTAAVHLLLTGDEEVAEAVRAWVDVQSDLAPIPVTADRFFTSTRRGLNVDAVRAVTRAPSTDTSDLWKQLTTALDQFSQHTPDYEAGTLTRKHLFSPGGALDEVVRIAAGGDGPALAAWWDAQGLAKPRATPDTWLDARTREVSDELITGSRRKSSFRPKVVAVLDPVRELVVRTERPADRVTAFLPEPDRVCLAELTQALPAVRDRVTRMGPGARPLAASALRDLDDLLGGGAQ